MATLNELLEKRTPGSRERIAARAKEIRHEITLAKIREELNILLTQLGASQNSCNSQAVPPSLHSPDGPV